MSLFFTKAIRTYTEIAIQICVFTAFSDVPYNALIRKCCFIHLKDSSICHLLLYRPEITLAESSKNVCQKHKRFACFKIGILDSPELFRIVDR